MRTQQGDARERVNAIVRATAVACAVLAFALMGRSR